MPSDYAAIDALIVRTLTPRGWEFEDPEDSEGNGRIVGNWSDLRALVEAAQAELREKCEALAAALDLLINPYIEKLYHYYRESSWRQHDDVSGTHSCARRYLRIADIVKLMDAKRGIDSALQARDRRQRLLGAAEELNRLGKSARCECVDGALRRYPVDLSAADLFARAAEFGKLAEEEK